MNEHTEQTRRHKTVSVDCASVGVLDAVAYIVQSITNKQTVTEHRVSLVSISMTTTYPQSSFLHSHDMLFHYRSFSHRYHSFGLHWFTPAKPPQPPTPSHPHHLIPLMPNQLALLRWRPISNIRDARSRNHRIIQSHCPLFQHSSAHITTHHTMVQYKQRINICQVNLALWK